MIKNYFKTAWRNLWRNKVFSAINILGLSIGLACCILMFLFIQHELSYDKFNANAKKIYRVTSIATDAKDRKELAVTPAPWAAEQRIREIGIRKVLGASVSGLVTLLSKEFIKLVLIASLLAIPVSWWMMNNWLSDFAYRTKIYWWVFVIAGALALIVALGTVGVKALKAAITNPVKSLRSE